MYRRAEAIRRILAGVDEVELGPLSAAVGRLRAIVYIRRITAEAET